MEDLSGAARPVNIKEVLIEGNTKTKEELIQAYTQDIKKATTLHELSQAVAVAKYHLSTLRIFDSCQFKLAPTTPSGTANAIVRITELEDNRKLGINAEIQVLLDSMIDWLLPPVRLYVLITIKFASVYRVQLSQLEDFTRLLTCLDMEISGLALCLIVTLTKCQT